MSGNIQFEKAAMNVRKGARSAGAGVSEYARNVKRNPGAAVGTVAKSQTPSWASWIFTALVMSLIWSRTVLDEDEDFTAVDAFAIAYLTIVVLRVFN